MAAGLEVVRRTGPLLRPRPGLRHDVRYHPPKKNMMSVRVRVKEHIFVIYEGSSIVGH